MNIEIRRIRYSEGEKARLLSYMYEVDESFPRPIHTFGDMEELAETWLRRHIVLFAMDGDTVCGVMIENVEDMDTRIGHTVIKAISASYRHKGIMTRLRTEMRRLAKEAGMNCIMENINPKNLASVNEMITAGAHYVGQITEPCPEQWDLLFVLPL